MSIHSQWNMSHKLLKRQLKAATVPAIAFVVCAVAFVMNGDTSQGDVHGGYVKDGRHHLHFYKGVYQETTPETFHERWQREDRMRMAMVGMIIFAIVTAIFVERAGLPSVLQNDPLQTWRR